ncbi:hypothetical protein MNBD_NITROSPIRAE01-949 [hydrothermal vent metagenome]|uniref:DUF2132 domain-containing protein n=1 Tax=hydrothermal vent metagenome TaxID=652676 RepID=A0A3B1CEH7_9ZZZZ
MNDLENQNLKSMLESFIQDVWNRGDFSNLENYLAPHYQIISDPGDPWEGETIDHATFKKRVLYSLNAFPDLNFSLQEMIQADGIVAVRWIMSATHLGDLPQLPATGKSFSINGLTFFYFEGNKLCGHAQNVDRLGFLAQIEKFSLSFRNPIMSSPKDHFPESSSAKKIMDKEQQNNPLHGITLEMLVTWLQDYYGWQALGERIKIRCFNSDPSVKSSLKFLRKTAWARKKVEDLYISTQKEIEKSPYT